MRQEVVQAMGMRIFGLTVGRNEAERYLDPMLAHMRDILGGHFFYDDRSDDQTPYIAGFRSCDVMIRREDMASFVENEGEFRGDAWRAFEFCMRPQEGDWVLVIDCDEVLVSSYGADPMAVQSVLESTITAAGNHPVNLTIPEVFGFSVNGKPLVRVDALWNTIHAPRLFPYRKGGHYFSGEFGVPAVPTYVQSSSWHTTEELSLMHYGYAHLSDQKSKYDRYNRRYGHSHEHVQSIISPPTLVEWQFPYVKEMRVNGDS